MRLRGLEAAQEHEKAGSVRPRMTAWPRDVNGTTRTALVDEMLGGHSYRYGANRQRGAQSSAFEVEPTRLPAVTTRRNRQY